MLFTYLYYLVLSPKGLDERLRGELAATQKQLEETKAEIERLKRHKVVFEIDEVSTRVFLQRPSENTVLITARIKLRFENLDSHNWNVKSVTASVHELKAPHEEEILTWIVDEHYHDHNGAKMLTQNYFEGMLLQGGELTPWYVYTVSLAGVQGALNRPEEFKQAHFLRVRMQASNQPPLDSSIFVDWGDALTERGATIISFGAPAVRSWENRRLRS